MFIFFFQPLVNGIEIQCWRPKYIEKKHCFVSGHHMLKSFLFFFRHIRCNFYIFEHRRIFYFKIRRLWTESCLTITLRLCYCNTLISPLNQIAFTTTREQLYQSVFVISCIVAQLTRVCICEHINPNNKDMQHSPPEASQSSSHSYKCSCFLALTSGKTHFETH